MARTFVTLQWVFLFFSCAQCINIFANIITHPLRTTIASYFCQRLQQPLSLNIFHHGASRCSRRYMQPEPTHARRKPMQPIPVTKVSCHFVKNVICAWSCLCFVAGPVQNNSSLHPVKHCATHARVQGEMCFKTLHRLYSARTVPVQCPYSARRQLP